MDEAMPPRPPHFPFPAFRPLCRAKRFCLFLMLACMAGSPAFALSTVQPTEPEAQSGTAPTSPIPAPDTTIPRSDDADELDVPVETDQPEAARPPNADTAPLDVFYGDEDLPAPVKTMRDLIMDACRRGDLEALRPLIGTGADITQLSLGGIDSDPVEYIKGLSGDTEGHEILAILLEVLEAGHVRMEAGTDNDIYVWPYFAGVSIETLTPQQRVELFKIITAGDYEDMLTYGAYIFYRVGISPDGKWQFFIAGD